MAALTWQTQHAQNQSDALGFARLGAQQIQSGITDAGNLINRLGQQEQAVFDKHKAAQTEQLLGQIAATGDRDEAVALRDQLNTDYLRTNYGDAVDVNQILSAAKARPDAIRQSILDERSFTESEGRRDFQKHLKSNLAKAALEADPATKSQLFNMLTQDALNNPYSSDTDLNNIFSAANLAQQVADVGKEVITPEQRKNRQLQIVEAENQLNVQQDLLTKAKQLPFSPENAAKLDQVNLADFGKFVGENLPDTDTGLFGLGGDSSAIDSTDYLGGEDATKFGSKVVNADFILDAQGKPIESTLANAKKLIAQTQAKQTRRSRRSASKKVSDAEAKAFLDSQTKIDIKPHHLINATGVLVPVRGVDTLWGSDSEVKADELLRLAAQMAQEEATQRVSAKEKVESEQERLNKITASLNKLTKLR